MNVTIFFFLEKVKYFIITNENVFTRMAACFDAA